MSKDSISMVYMIVYRIRGKQFIYGTGGFTSSLFKPKYYKLHQDVHERYIKETQSFPAQGHALVPITLKIINAVSKDCKKTYLDFLLSTRPACLALPAQDLKQILDTWVIYPDEITELMDYCMRDSKKAVLDVREGFIEKYRLYDIGISMQAMLSFYDSGILQEL
ncbi:hypothetical protein GCM10027566_06810 [Arachidicoccus ginsenosidivorans]|uniref:Uncharacterized protein n=1 Tax=Arachidicoccus ginsenosidivorans TaxID=496057 RepID=A0A5B8VQP0_9BACT|nr:hypothetical protein [Arachidicoccus ginsenosidivorans]QEC73937.1 hypothetical protein FSB73_21980 [Arachidicoccus ginsenosidivorans]